MDVVRTPDERFADLPGYPFEPRYTEVSDGEGGWLRVHHVDEGPRDGPVVLCMHGQPTWSYLYRHMIPILTGAGLRVIAPDLPGYGRSDKPAALQDYSYQRQVDWMSDWLLANGLHEVTLVGQDWGGLIGLRLVAAHPDRFARVVAANTGLPVPRPMSDERAAAARRLIDEGPTPTMAEMATALSQPDPAAPELAFARWQRWCVDTEDLPVGAMIALIVDGRTLSEAEVAAYDAPFPDPAHKMGPRAMPSKVPTLPHDPAEDAQREAWAVLERFDRPFICAFTDNDPVTRGGDARFRERIPGAAGQPHTTIEGGGHFLQEGRAVELSQVVIDAVRAGTG